MYQYFAVEWLLLSSAIFSFAMPNLKNECSKYFKRQPILDDHWFFHVLKYWSNEKTPDGVIS